MTSRKSRPKKPAFRASLARSPLTAILAAAVLLLGGAAAWFHAARSSSSSSLPPEGNIAVRYLSVGQGDATLLSSSDGRQMLIDAGTNEAADHLVGELERYGVTTLDALILTHNHEDHIGGADEVLEAFQVSQIFFNGREGADTASYRHVKEAAEKEAGCRLHYAEEFDGGLYSFAFSSATVTLAASPLYPCDEENNNSQAVRVDFGTTVFLFTGDAEEEEELALLNRYGPSFFDADILQLGHHGSSTSSCERFLDSVTPDAAIISCGKGNSYGHPHGETLLALQKRGISYYRTDAEGDIFLESDGEKISYHPKN